ncbi:formimidoylglutamate deiminase [Roseobacter ponti]|uniref:Formimidoylglutamate deiminase n=1 Tax=Roseobacter ponti TaxID=1891787 RepID=A0A858SSJ6_9RHOB|nr:formimidoylglutamate deiminase [Roseobacter ponti]QJF51645.1 formimidoylglutamate deiminase [Roseobacter ponti]
MQEIWAEKALLPQGWAEAVLVEAGAEGLISRVTTGAEPRGHRTGILLPAPVNVHSHAFQRAMAGLTERRGPQAGDSFWTWRQLMYRFLDHLNPDQVEAIAAFVQMEMQEAGYAASAEFHYLHHGPGGVPYDAPGEMSERIVAASGQSGIGLCLLPVLYTTGGCDGRLLDGGQRRFGNEFDAFAQLCEDARRALGRLPQDAGFGVAPHSLRAVRPDDLRACADFFPDVPVHMHLAEQRAEVAEVEAALGARPVTWMLDNMPPDPRWCLIHCTQMTPGETTALAATGAVAGLCPITESSLGDGIFDGVRWAGAGGAFAVGSDSNIRISLAEELRTLEYSQRLRDGSRAALATREHSAGRRIFDAVCAGGARAAGRRSGEIAAGHQADLMALDALSVHLWERSGDQITDAWIFAGSDALVTDLWSSGRHMVREGRHIHKDRITTAYLRTMSGLRDIL